MTRKRIGQSTRRQARRLESVSSMEEKMNTKCKLWTLIATIVLATYACAVPAPVPSYSPSPEEDEEVIEEPELPPDENFGDITIDWRKGLADPANAGLAIVAIGGVAVADDALAPGIGLLDDPVAVILIAGIVTYAVVSNPELVADTAEAVVTGVQGLRDWVAAYAAPANESEQAKEIEKVNTKPNTNQPKRIAHIEDSPSWQKIVIRMLSNFQVATFPSCEVLIAALAADQTLNFTAYIVDNDLGPGMRGPACVQQILTLRPGVVIVGLSGGSDDPGFVDSGAKSWISKTRVGPETFRNLLP